MSAPRDLLLAQVDLLRDNIDTWSQNDDNQSRQSLREAALKLANDLETPLEICERISFEPVTSIAVVTALDAGWLSYLASKEGPVSASELVAVSGCSHDFLIRFMRVLTVQNIVKEHDTEQYRANAVTRHLAAEVTKEYTKHVSMLHAQGVMQIPQWARKNGFQEPITSTKGPFASHFGRIFWDVLDDNPQANSAFKLSMDQFHNEDVTKADVAVIYDDLSANSIAKSASIDEEEITVFVDIGGSSGYMAKLFRRLYPNIRGRLISQDRATVVELAQKDENPEKIENIAYDFFTPQPIKNSRAYCLRHILHDWPDADCQKILENTAQAMSSDSRLYIFDMIVPDKGCHMVTALLDIMLLAAISGKERSHTQWERLLASAGLKLCKVIIVDEATGDGVIVAMLADKS